MWAYIILNSHVVIDNVKQSLLIYYVLFISKREIMVNNKPWKSCECKHFMKKLLFACTNGMSFFKDDDRDLKIRIPPRILKGLGCEKEEWA